jgi:hypothetical protein
METLNNKEFYTRPCHYNKVLRKYNNEYYLVEEKDLISGDAREDILYTEEQINKYLSEQDFIIDKVNKAIESNKKMLEIERQEQEKREAKEREYNNTYGYADNMSPMAKGKVLKILNKTENYYDNGKYIGTIVRKDFIKNILESGGNVEHKTNISNWNKKSEVTIKANEYRLVLQDNSFYIITKTEYDYSIFLKDKLLKEAI